MRIACVTGATGMIGQKIVGELLRIGYRVRILSRKQCSSQGVDVFRGSITDISVIDKFIFGADAVFHCAAEINDESSMWKTNVLGTHIITDLISKYNVKFFCYLSSAGVIGRTSLKVINEECFCAPQNQYEYTKLQAERLIEQKKMNCRSVILRPTNVVDAHHLGDLRYPVDGSLKSFLHVFIKGGECSHIVHSDDVARAAMFFLNNATGKLPQKYFISIDMDPENTVSRLWTVYQEIFSGDRMQLSNRKFSHLPIFVPYCIRSILGKPSNWGDIRYSSQKLLSEGFKYQMGVREIIKEILRTRMSINP